MLEAGAAVDLADSEGTTPLNIAAQNGHEAVVRVLLEAGADSSLVDAVIRMGPCTHKTLTHFCYHRAIRRRRFISRCMPRTSQKQQQRSLEYCWLTGRASTCETMFAL